MDRPRSIAGFEALFLAGLAINVAHTVVQYAIYPMFDWLFILIQVSAAIALTWSALAASRQRSNIGRWIFVAILALSWLAVLALVGLPLLVTAIYAMGGYLGVTAFVIQNILYACAIVLLFVADSRPWFARGAV